MHARMTLAQAQADRFDEALASVQESFVPAAREQGGYRGFLLLTDRSRHQLVGISFWDTDAHMHDTGSVGGYYRQQMDDFVGLLVGPPTTTIHEVEIREP